MRDGLVASAFQEVTADTAAAARWLDWADLFGRTMRVLLTGASGFIGSAIAAALQARGHAVVRVQRRAPGDGGDVVQADFARPPGRAWWEPRLAGIDAVVNAVGILRDRPGQRFQALHVDAPLELFHACVAAGVPVVLQVSALGADDQARSAYHRSKKQADDALRALPLAPPGP